jgi:Fe-S cluster assembly scaffold protein SufB
MMNLDEIEKNLIKEVSGVTGVPDGAYNFRLNGKSIGRQSSENINVDSLTDKDGLKITIKPGTKDEAVHIPVIIDASGHKETVHNEFIIGEGAEVTIVAGCGIYNCGVDNSMHNGVHVFRVGKNARVRYIEKHYGMGPGAGKILNPTTELYLEEGAEAELEMEQIKGVDSANRKTVAELAAGAKIKINERLFTHGRQTVDSKIQVTLIGEDSTADIVSRAVARDESDQNTALEITGQSKCRGHSECDAILMDDAKVKATPILNAENLDAELIHEAAIGKIAGEQLTKLMTLGLTREQAEAQIINGFLK